MMLIIIERGRYRNVSAGGWSPAGRGCVGVLVIGRFHDCAQPVHLSRAGAGYSPTSMGGVGGSV